jgi:hypothetical protein
MKTEEMKGVEPMLSYNLKARDAEANDS